MKNEFLCGGDWIRIRGERQDNAADRERLPLDRGSCQSEGLTDEVDAAQQRIAKHFNYIKTSQISLYS